MLRKPKDGVASRGHAQVLPGPHAYDGSYTELRLRWQGIVLDVRSAHDGNDLVLLVEPVEMTSYPATLVAEAGILYNRPGWTARDKDHIIATLPERRSQSTVRRTPSGPTTRPTTPILPVRVASPVCIATGHMRTVDEHGNCDDRVRAPHWPVPKYTANVRSCITHADHSGWDTIYEPKKDGLYNRKPEMGTSTGRLLLFELGTLLRRMDGFDRSPRPRDRQRGGNFAELPATDSSPIRRRRKHISDTGVSACRRHCRSVRVLDKWGPGYNWVDRRSV